MCSNRRRPDWEEREYYNFEKEYKFKNKMGLVVHPILSIVFLIAGIAVFSKTQSFFIMLPFILTSVIFLIFLIVCLVGNKRRYNERTYEKMKRDREKADSMWLVGAPILFVVSVIFGVVAFLKTEMLILTVPFALVSFIFLIVFICCLIRSRR